MKEPKTQWCRSCSCCVPGRFVRCPFCCSSALEPAKQYMKKLLEEIKAKNVMLDNVALILSRHTL